MVISVLSSQDIEFFKDNPSPVYSFVDDVTKMVDIAPLKAKKRPCNEVQEGVKVKCCDYNFEPSVNHLKYMSSPYDCESKYPYPTILLGLAACTSCHALLKATGFGCAG